MTRVLGFIVVAVILVWPIRVVVLRARGLERTPRAAIVLWQSIGLGVAMAFVGACAVLVGLSSSAAPRRRAVTDFTTTLSSHHAPETFSPNELFGFTAGLIVSALVLGALLVRTVGLLRRRAHQRALIDLVGDERAGIAALIVDHPTPTAFSLPGRHPRVVVSSGAIEVLSDEELAAVLAHERAHVHARHDLVLLPFRSLCAALPRSRVLRAICDRVQVLVEMAADDRALRECDPVILVRALCSLTSDGDVTVSGPLSAAPVTPAGDRILQRVERTFTVRIGAKRSAVISGLSAMCVLALPLAAWFAPLGVR